MEKKKIILYISGGIFLLLDCLAIWMELFVFPFISLFALLVYLLVYRLDILLYLMAFVTPLSVPLRDAQVNLELSLPSEVIMIMVSFLFLLRILYDLSFDKSILRHPVSMALYAYLLWLVISTITSELPVVSVKYVISRLWFIFPCYFMGIHLFKKGILPVKTFFTLHAIGVAIVVIYTTIHHAMWDFSEASGHWVMSPFYNDHTAYGAILAFMIPIVTGFYFLPGNTQRDKILFAVLFVILSGGLYLSFSRAAWLSMIGAAGVWAILKLRIKLSWCILAAVIFGASFYFFSDDILYKMGKNTQDSSGNLKEQIQSMSNIRTDASNVERLNRWMAAKGMIEERPITGWGPGTYQFTYAPFQKGKYKTIISTNFGDGGNAHSEYIGPWAETGTVGLLTILVLVLLILYYGITTYIRSNNPFIRIISLSMTIALITYFIHGFLNNFLDTDKLALPYWSAFAAIVTLNVYGRRKEFPEDQSSDSSAIKSL